MSFSLFRCVKVRPYHLCKLAMQWSVTKTYKCYIMKVTTFCPIEQRTLTVGVSLDSAALHWSFSQRWVVLWIKWCLKPANSPRQTRGSFEPKIDFNLEEENFGMNGNRKSDYDNRKPQTFHAFQVKFKLVSCSQSHKRSIIVKYDTRIAF